jgi:hypothetical protein
VVRPALTRLEIALLPVLLAAALSVRLLLVVGIPPYQAPDERAHVRYVEHVVANRRLPVQPPPEFPRVITAWEQYFQPPLAYVLFAPLARASALAGATDAQRVRWLRAQNALYGAATVLVGFWVVASVTPAADPRRWLVAVWLAFLPGFVGATSAVNNDGLAVLLCTAVWLPLIAPVRSTARPVVLGAALGVACLAKLTALPLVPLLLVAPLLRGATAREAFREIAVAGAVAGVVMAAWLARNVLLYGEPFGTSRALLSSDWLATLLPPEAVAAGFAPQPLKAFLQFWGRFGVYNNLDWVGIPTLLVPIAALSAAGWLRARPSAGDAVDRHAALFLLSVVLATAVMVVQAFQYYSGWQGRYLYAALLPASALLASGWARWFRGRRSGVAVAALALALLAVDLAMAWKLQRFYATARPARWGLRLSL